ncbi:hypothetical protein N8H71_02645 [Pseudomonas koreensis]|uniref:hypothetical protein n=1 Tax=Pseudomonas koreensis TaxID=198620 RepID=UPI0021C9E762|nr:hypothetical protein [Pseudomonas koreensis]MCU0070469.1 hypothetical protein [Pseudomonas koreensis]
MNPHFRREGIEYPRPSFPFEVYARFDHVEASANSQNVMLAFDLVDKAWLDGQGQSDPLFHPDSARSRKAWDDWKRKGLWSTRNPFDSMPMYRLELELPATQGFFGESAFNTQKAFSMRSAAGELERKWFELCISSHHQRDSEPASLYPGLFAAPLTVFVQGKMPSRQRGEALSAIFSLDHLPSISTADLEAELAGKSADLLAVYDVGQGNANALLSTVKYGAPGVPTLYYDLGAGVYRNRRTTPKSLVFCFSEKPTILLSHWDADHWGGAYASMIKSAYPALKRKWIAPHQPVGPVHIAFAHDVLANGGTFFTYSIKADVGSIPLAQGRNARFTLGDGPDRNGTGLVLTVEEPDHAPRRCWLLTGDCDYLYFDSKLNPYPPVGLVAPHHGADLDPASVVPKPPDNVIYKRLAYSFGRDNRHGQNNVQHPTSKGMSAHNSADWDHQYWDPLNPGEPSPGGDVLATCEHTPGNFRGGALIGWDAQPAIANAPCQGKNCGVPLTQS